MKVKLRYTGSEDEVFETSKCNLTEVLFDEASNIFKIPSEQTALIFRGCYLKRDDPLLVHNIKEMDVVLVVKKARNNNNNIFKSFEAPHQDEHESSKSAPKGESAGLFKSKYFEIGDILYYQNAVTGEWREAKLVSIDKDDLGGLLYTVQDGTLDQSKQVTELDLRSCSWEAITLEKLIIGDEVLAYTSAHRNDGWFHIVITKLVETRSKPKVRGAVIFEGKQLPEKEIKFVYNLIKFPKNLIYRTEWTGLSTDGIGLNTPCTNCLDCPSVSCKTCACSVCGGKHDEEKQVLCDECETVFHTGCHDPPLASLPADDEWYCSGCSHKDMNREKKQEKKKKEKVEKAKKTLKEGNKRDWGSGKSVAGVTDRFSVVPNNHIGRIPGVPSGRLFDSRLCASKYGVHRPPVAGISGRVNEGVASVCFSGGYEGDYDKGDEFVMSGSGGRDLSGNKRTEKQSSSQELTRFNLALAQSCHVKVNSVKGANAGVDWRKGLPIRVVRGYKLAKLSQFAPVEGYRYDGLYKVVKYYKEEHKGFGMWKYLLRRDDIEPAPWTKEGAVFMDAMSVGHMETSDKDGETDEEAKQKKSEKVQIGVKRTASKEKSLGQPARKLQKMVPYKLAKDIKKLIKKDAANAKKWGIIQDSLKSGYPAFVKSVAEEFACNICQEVVKEPCTLTCSHNYCFGCLERCTSKKCPLCQKEEVDYKSSRNQMLKEVLQMIIPGYDVKLQPKPYSIVKADK